MIGEKAESTSASQGEGDGKSKAKSKNRSIIFDGDVVGQDLVLGFENVIDGVVKENPTLPPGARVVETDVVEEGDGTEAADAKSKSAAIMKEVNEAFMGIFAGLDNEERVPRSKPSAGGGGKGNNIIDIRGKVSGSNVIVGNHETIDGSEPILDLEPGSEITLPEKIALDIENATVKVVDKDGTVQLKKVVGLWSYRRRDDQNRAIYVREREE